MERDATADLAATAPTTCARARFRTFSSIPAGALFHIGLRVAEHQLDKSFYDLFASESRLASLWAIAKGDVPVSHWAALGRPFYRGGTRRRVCASWSGSMFEYLMPSLVLDEPRGSALGSAACAAMHEQIEYARIRDVPWGISESAYAASDHTLAYQYAPQGVPRLALRRTPARRARCRAHTQRRWQRCSIPTPPRRICARLEALGARGEMGFVEAVDFTPERQTGDRTRTIVNTFMAHHQGMTIVALANVLLDGRATQLGHERSAHQRRRVAAAGACSA